MRSIFGFDVHEPGVKARSERLSCKIGEQVDFDTQALASYCFAQWEPLVFDALLIAAAVEFCDRSQRRATHHWSRRFEVRIPVHDPRHWGSSAVKEALLAALSFLTGDDWQIEFVERRKAQPPPMQSCFVLPSGSHTIIPFSEGMDSRAVAGLETRALAQSLLRVRLGSKMSDLDCLARYGHAFASVPYTVQAGAKSFAESSARSRGFKFATISGVTAYLAKASGSSFLKAAKGHSARRWCRSGRPMRTTATIRSSPIGWRPTSRHSSTIGRGLNFRACGTRRARRSRRS